MADTAALQTSSVVSETRKFGALAAPTAFGSDTIGSFLHRHLKTIAESMIHAEMDPPVEDGEIAILESEIQAVLADVATAVADFEGTNALRVVSNIGRRLDAHKSSTGRVLLARLPEDEVTSLYAGDPNLERLVAELARVRAQGFAFSEQESTPGVDAVAVAVGDPATEEAVALCIVYPHTQADEAARAEMVAALGAGGKENADTLGDPGFVPPKLHIGSSQ